MVWPTVTTGRNGLQGHSGKGDVRWPIWLIDVTRPKPGGRGWQSKSLQSRENSTVNSLQRGECGVTFVAPLKTPWRVKPQQPDRSESAATLTHATGSAWRQDVDEDMAALTAAVDTPGPHNHALPPRTVAEGLARPDVRWQAVIDEELAPCRKFGVWEEVHLPEKKQALPSVLIFEIKRDGRYKARLVAGGHRQRLGLDFEETYASVGCYRTMRMMMAIAAHEDLELRQFDIRTTSLNAWLQEEGYLQVPAGLKGKLGKGEKVLRLRRAIYGLRQASQAWNEGELSRSGFVQSNADPSLWIIHRMERCYLCFLLTMTWWRQEHQRKPTRW
jgi:hypothetical protein